MIKVFAMGFALGEGSYLRDRWNWLDFVVTITAALYIVPGVPEISVLRAFRVIRPMRALRRLPGMRALVRSLLNSIPGLLNVAALIALVCFIWGAVGVQLWMGSFHQRCRLTGAPIFMNESELVAPPLVMEAGFDSVYWTNLGAFARGNASASPESYAYVWQLVINRTAYPLCADAAGNPVDVSSGAAWGTPLPCVWPIDTSDTELCGGIHDCEPLVVPQGTIARVCGTNYDTTGAPRFLDARFMLSDVFLSALDYGVTSFDNLYSSILAMMEAVTQSGWSDLLYYVRMHQRPPARRAFCRVMSCECGSRSVLHRVSKFYAAPCCRTKSRTARSRPRCTGSHCCCSARSCS
jgi:hypothetical protein